MNRKKHTAHKGDFGVKYLLYQKIEGEYCHKGKDEGNQSTGGLEIKACFR